MNAIVWRRFDIGQSKRDVLGMPVFTDKRGSIEVTTT
jgi:hypothetical protein